MKNRDSHRDPQTHGREEAGLEVSSFIEGPKG